MKIPNISGRSSHRAAQGSLFRSVPRPKLVENGPQDPFRAGDCRRLRAGDHFRRTGHRTRNHYICQISIGSV